jgi:hypothetical protein
MSSPRWMSLMRRVCFYCGTAILAAGSASGQSTTSPNPANSSLIAANESSSSSLQLAADEGLDGAAALRTAAAALGSGAGGGQADAGGRHGLFSNFAFEAGAGANAPVGNDTPFITWGGNITVGGGFHFSNRFALLAEYQFIDDKLPGNFVADLGTQGGDAHIWSLTLDPVIDLFPKATNSVYVTGGGGFYRKLTSFTDPEEVEECYYYCGIGVVNQVVGHYSSNQGGLNVGLGITHRLGGSYGDSRAKLFAEARYLFLETPEFPPGFTEPVGTTELIPVTLGVRF